MKKGFTLIELIFVIVIIGVLAGVAVPKFLNLKQNAEASNVVKTVVDTAQQAAEVGINWRDLEGNDYNQSGDGDDFNLSEIVKLNGKGWTYEGPSAQIPNGDGYKYVDSGNDVAFVEMNKTNILYRIDCTQFSDATTQDKCKTLLDDNNEVNVTLSW